MNAWKIGGPFGRSPFGPAHEHFVKASACVAVLPTLVEAFNAGDLEEVRRQASQVHQLEREADLIKTDVRNRLSRNIFSAAERADIMMLLRVQDNVADRAQEAVGMMELRATAVPDALKAELVLLAQDIHAASTYITQVEAQLAETELLDASVVKRLKERLDPFYAQAHEIALNARKCLKLLFSFEGNLDPLSTLFLMQIIDLLNRVCDELENTADVLVRLMER